MNTMKNLILLLILSQSILAATIEGTVYDFDLSQISAIVEINTTPNQKIVAPNGDYKIELPKGKYTIKAHDLQNENEIIEQFEITNEGQYILDLILLPSLDAEEFILSEEEVPDVDGIIEEKPAYSWIVWLIIFVALAYLVLKVSKGKEEKIIEKETIIKETQVASVTPELEQILKFVEDKEGRTTQKEIRKEFPHSEAKISLMLDELEAKGLLKRMKKGRANIVVKL